MLLGAYYLILALIGLLCWDLTYGSAEHRALRIFWRAVGLVIVVLPIFLPLKTAFYYGLLANSTIFSWSADTWTHGADERRGRSIFGAGVLVSICSQRLTNSIPNALKVSSARSRWETERAKRSKRQTTTASKRRRCAPAIRRSSSGRFSLAPEIPTSTYSPASRHPRRWQYSLSSRVCTVGSWPLLAVETLA